MSAQDENNLGLANAIRDLNDDEFLQALEYGRSTGIGELIREGEAAMGRVATEDTARARAHQLEHA